MLKIEVGLQYKNLSNDICITVFPSLGYSQISKKFDDLYDREYNE